MADPFDIQGPSFTIEPPHHLEFTNIIDNHIDCVAKGSPPPKIEWLHIDNTPVTTIPRVSRYRSLPTLQNACAKSKIALSCWQLRDSHLCTTKINSIEAY